MLGALLECLEDPKRRLLGINIRSFRATGLILPKNRIGRILRLFIHTNVLYFVITQFTEAYILKDDLGLLLTNLKIAMLSSSAFCKICSCIFFQESWQNLFNYITENDQFERDNHDEAREVIINKYTKSCRKVTYIYWVIMFNTHLSVVIRSLVLYNTTFQYGGSTPFPHIFSSWTLFDKETSPGCWLLVIWHYLLCVNGATVVGAYDAGIVVIITFFGARLDLLRERCKHMFGNGEGLSDAEFKANLRDLHHKHVQLIKHCRLLNSILSPVMFQYLVLCTLMLCSSLFQLTSETDPLQIVLVGQYLAFGVAQLFIVCLPSNNCFIKSREVSLGPYESEWWKSEATTRQKKDLLLLCGQLRQTTKFTAGPFVDLNLPTFVTVLKGAYSYYALLRD